MLLVFYGCASVKNQKITITGTAIHTKGGPAVSADGNVYYIDNLVYWNKENLEKKVTVTGILTYVPNPEPEDKNELRQYRGGLTEYLVIKEAAWVLKE